LSHSLGSARLKRHPEEEWGALPLRSVEDMKEEKCVQKLRRKARSENVLELKLWHISNTLLLASGVPQRPLQTLNLIGLSLDPPLAALQD
jgi:hypothetical protein